jgi:hypothetical protein
MYQRLHFVEEIMKIIIDILISRRICNMRLYFEAKDDQLEAIKQIQTNT